MKKILLVCSGGMSTSMLVTKMREEAKVQGIEAEINAMAISEADAVIDKMDIVLLGPQVRFHLKEIEKMAKGRIPVKVIDMLAYGKMDGKAVLNDALASL